MSPGPATAATRPRPAARVSRRERAVRRGCVPTGAAAALLLLLACATLAHAGPEPVRTPGSKDQYRSFVASWTARNADGVVALMPARGALRLSLMSPAVSGSYQKAHAKHALKGYFDGVASPTLKDITDKDQRMPRGWAMRTYEYRYVPQGRDPVVTRLTVTMKGDGRGGWTLDSIQETGRR